MHSRMFSAIAMTAGIGAAMVGAALPAAASPSGAVVSHYTVVETANVHSCPAHSCSVIKIKHAGDGVTSPNPLCFVVVDPDGTLWIEVNLATGGEGWMGNGQLSPFCHL